MSKFDIKYKVLQSHDGFIKIFFFKEDMTINFLIEILSVKSLNMDDVNVKLCLLKDKGCLVERLWIPS